MEIVYRESEPLLPKAAMYALAGIFVSGVAFMALSGILLNAPVPTWMILTTVAIFGVYIVVVYFVKLEITVTDKNLTIKLIKEETIEFENVIDHKIGDIDILRNYSGWGFKKVKFKNYICAGYDQAISLKLMGKRVVTISTENPEDLARLIPVNKE